MKNRQRLIVATGLLVGLVLAFIIPDSRWAIIGLFRNESFYRGKPTSYWVTMFHESGDKPASPFGEEPTATALFRDALYAHGSSDLGDLFGGHDPRAIPVLLQMLDNSNAALRKSTVRALGFRGPRAGSAIPALLFIYRDRRAQQLHAVAARALHRIDPETAKREGVVQPVDPPVLGPGEGALPFAL